MRTIILLLMSALLPQLALADTHKCIQAGKTSYQEEPCGDGKEITPNALINQPIQSQAPAVTGSAPVRTKCVGDEMSINFHSMPIVTTLKVVADYSGNRLQADSTITGSAPFRYICTPWREVLKDIASRHALSIRVENGSILATKH